MTMKAGKSTTSMRQMASIPSSGYSTTSTFLMQLDARMAAGPLLACLSDTIETKLVGRLRLFGGPLLLLAALGLAHICACEEWVMHNLIVTMPPGKVVKGIKRPKAKALKPPYPKRKPKKASGKASAARLKLAADHGTKVHSYIEDYVKSDGNSDHIPKKTLLGKKALALIEHATKKMKLKLWQAEVYAKSPFLTNKRMFIDCLALDKNKRVVVIDWKTRSASSAVHLATFKAKTADAIPGTNLCSNDKNRFMLQVAAYALVVQEKYGLCEPPLAYILVCTNDLLVHEYQLEDWALDPTRGYLRRKSEAEQSAKRQIKTSRDSLALFLKFLNKHFAA